MKVYVVFSIWVDDDKKIYDLDMIFKDKEKAQKYVYNRISPECYEIEELEVQ